MLAGDCDGSCAASAIELALALAEGALPAPCPEAAASLCVSDSFEPAPAYGAMVTGLVNGAAAAVYERACAGSAEGCAAAYRSALVDIVLPRVDSAYAVVCGLPGAGTCVDRQEMLARFLTWGYYDAAFEMVCETGCASSYRDAVAGVVVALADQAAPFVCGTGTAASCPNGSRASAFVVIGRAALPSSGLVVQIQRGVTGACGVTLETQSSSSMQVAGVSNPCVDAVVTLANTVLTIACGSTDPVTCANELVETTNELLVSVCSDSVASSAEWASLTPPMWTSANVSHPCVDLTVAAVNLVLRTACASTDPLTCATNLVTTINELLITACTITTLGPDSSPPEVNGIELVRVAHPCVERTFEALNVVLTTTCGSTDLVVCADNLIRQINELLISACTLSSVGYDSSPPEVNGIELLAVSHPCVERAFEAVNSVLTTVCNSTDAATCALNLVDTINELLISVCTQSVAGSDTTLRVVNGIELADVSHPCVQKAFAAVNLVLTTVCGSTDAATCADNLIRQINELLISACTLSSVGYDSSPPEVNGIELLAASHPCVERAFEAVNSVLTTVCNSTDAATCALNLVDTINELLISVCTQSVAGSDTTLRVVNGIELADVSHPCVQKAFAAVNLVLTTVCGSTDAATCADNLIRQINELLISVCTQPVLDTEAGPLTVNGVEVTNVSHPCVEAAYDVVALVLTTACGSADAAICADNLLTTIDELVVAACESAPLADSDEPAIDVVALSHPCVDAAFDAVDLVISTVCGPDDAVTCVQDLLTQVGALIEDACAAGPTPTSPLSALTDDAGKTVSNQCVEKAFEVVNLILSTVCDEADAAQCSTGLLDDVVELLAASCGLTTGVDSPDPHACAQAALDLVMDALPNVCVGGVDVELALVDCSASAADALADLIEAALEQVNAAVVDFQVYPRRIDPTAGSGPRVVNVDAQVTLGAWRIEVRDANGQPVRVFPGFTGLTAVTWDGRDALGNVVPPGAYEVVLLAPKDDVATESAWVFVGQSPSIAGVFPSSVSIGDSLTIAGSGFTRGLGVFGVTIGDEEALVSTWSDTHVVVHVPPTLEPGTYDLVLTAADADATIPVTIKNNIPVTTGNSANVTRGVIRVQLKPGASMASVAAAVGDAAFEPSAPAGYPELADWFDVTVPAGSEGSRILAYAGRPEVAFAEPVFYRTPTATPNDRRYGDQWYLKTQPNDADIDAPEAWSIRKGSSSVTVGILDTQVGAHEDLDVVSVTDYPGTCAHSLDGSDHGTFVAGQAAARTNNTTGVAGVAWGARLREYRLAVTSTVNGDCVISGLNWPRALLLAAQQDEVVNMSFGGDDVSEYEQRAVDSAWARGLLMAAAAGNDGTTIPHFPAAYRNVVAVGALNQRNIHASFSNRGPWVDVNAPGVAATSTARTDSGVSTYESGWDGTSMASPLVAGALALLRSHEPALPSANLVFALVDNTQGTPPRISISNALSKIIRITLPSGLFVKTSTNGTVWFLGEGGWKRRVGSRVLQSWGIQSASSPHVATVRPELLTIGYPSTGPSLGFRPGTLLREPGSSTTYVVTTDGSEPWLRGEKRALTPEVMLCLHYDEARVVEVGKSELSLNPTGTAAGCDRHPNGTMIKTPTVTGTAPGVTATETLEVIVAGQRRKFTTSQLAASWGYTQDGVLPTASDLLLPAGPPMGFRPGKILRNGGRLWVVTAAGADLARATLRQFSTASSINCYRLQNVPRVNATTAELAIHAKGSTLGC